MIYLQERENTKVPVVVASRKSRRLANKAVPYVKHFSSSSYILEENLTSWYYSKIVKY